MTDPERWLTSEDAPAGMRELLVGARAAGPTAAQRAALGAKIGVASSAAWISPLLKALAIGAAVAGGGILYSTMSAPEKSTGPIAVTAPQKHVNDIALTEETEEATVAREETVEAAQTDMAEAEHATAKAQAAKKPSEAQLLSQAKATLSTAPSRSLALLAQHEKLYPNGVLAEEREVMKVRALQNTGRLEAAEKQAREFRKSHPDSIHHVPTDK